MTSDRKHPSAALGITVALVVVLVGYPLSMGPACWISSRLNAGARAVTFAYEPINWIRDRSPVSIADALDRYSQLGAAEGWCWRTHFSEEGFLEPGSHWSEYPQPL
jgi:hypothetical protein